MKVAIVQSNYLPWKGFFDMVHDVDVFVFYDDVQYTVRDWRNRNLIKTPHGLHWLTVPVEAGSRDRRICEVAIGPGNWQDQHWQSLVHHYGAARHFKFYKPFFEEIYLGRRWTNLSELNQHLIKRISFELLGIETTFISSTDYALEGRKQDRLLAMLAKLDATSYLSGPSARAYIEPEGFERAGISLEYKDYSDYPEYPQFHPPFTHGVSIVDLLFHVGPEAPRLIWGQRELVRTVPKADAKTHVPESRPAIESPSA